MDFRVLGPLEVGGDEGPLELGGVKQRSLLAMLLLHANEVVSTDRLIDALWGASPPFTSGKSIQVYVSRLRKAMADDRLVTRAPGYVLYVDPAELDLARFEQLVAEARARLARDAPRRSCARRSRSGAGRRWRTWRTSSSRRRRSRGWRRCGSARSSSGSRPTSRSAATPSWWPSSRRSLPAIRCASASGTS